MNKILIIGDHPLKTSIEVQCRERGAHDIAVCDGRGLDSRAVADCDEMFLLTSPLEEDALAADQWALQTLQMIAELLHPAGETRQPVGGASYMAAQLRPTVHLLLQRQETLDMLLSRDYNDSWHAAFELHAFTMEDTWAKNVVASPAGTVGLPGLDYRPVTLDADHTVHLVIFGTSRFTTALAENTALVAHYPNYTRNHNLRTRITIIAPDVEVWSHTFIGRHKSLMDNSYWRHIDLQTKRRDLHRPMYEASREDFVDVEWEFVRGSIHDVVVQDKLQGWSADDGQVLSVALCHDSDADNLAQMQLLADLLCGTEVPIYVKQRSAVFEEIIAPSPRLRHVILIGMEDRGYDVTLPLLRMAQRVKYVYDYCYDHNINGGTQEHITAPACIAPAEAESHWLLERKAIKRHSNVSNAMTIDTKMRSLHSPGRQSLSDTMVYALTQNEIELIAEVEHNRWSVEELLQGFRPCTAEEQAAIEGDIRLKAEFKERLVHYDLRAYRDLRPDATGQNANTYDLCLSASIPLIASGDHRRMKDVETKTIQIP